jgi:amyloid beta precursor protein binding protein 1
LKQQVRSLFSDHKASPESKCTDTFWVLVQALRLFVEGEGRGSLPLSGSIPDMHSDTKSYVELQTIYKTQVNPQPSTLNPQP